MSVPAVFAAPRAFTPRALAVRLCALVGLLALAACETAPPDPQFARLTYAHKPKIQLDVADIVIRQDYQPPMARPNVDHLFPVRPSEAAMQWAEDRLVAAGDSGSATYVVTDASAVVENLETDQSLRDYFTTEQSERYRANVAVKLMVEKPSRSGEITVTAERGTTVPEDSSVNDRRRTWHRMTEQLMDDLNRELESTLRDRLGNWVIN